ncbi:oligosaccharide flippase family protein [Brachyspira hyodysenteriae]|uniref:lipopolysaccharide biosynthesis protein n=1 Tax=Brachyspira hyodysenteriae TaxID=159 RepID=UPI001ADDB257|nr:oligosaccharide flippase family protein [Brachyspira hyodysenteriae]QTM02292.1 oligosaccharide flippase family protein [Brachyspira hyodysenteriae]
MNNIKLLYKKYSYYINYALLVFINGIASVLNYVSSIYVNRSLSISDFAHYNGIINIYSIIVLTVSSFSYYIMHHYKDDEDAKVYWAYGYIIALIITLLYLLSIPLIDILFNIKSYPSLFIISIGIFATILGIVSQSILKINNYIAYDYTASLIAILISKILLLAYFIITGLTLFKSIITVTLFCVLYLIINLIELKKVNLPYFIPLNKIKLYFSKQNLSVFLSYIIHIVIINFIFNWISLSDVLMANRYLDKTSAGYYSTISLIIKMFFYIGTPVASVMFSYILIAKKDNNKNKERKIVYYSIALFVFASICLSAFLIIFAKQIVLIQFTNRYEAIIPLIPQAVIFGFSLGFTVIAFNYGLAYKLFAPFYGYLIIFAYVYFSLRNGLRTFENFMFIMKIFFIALLIYNILIILIHRIILKTNEKLK